MWLCTSTHVFHLFRRNAQAGSFIFTIHDTIPDHILKGADLYDAPFPSSKSLVSAHPWIVLRNIHIPLAQSVIVLPEKLLAIDNSHVFTTARAFHAAAKQVPQNKSHQGNTDHRDQQSRMFSNFF